jgi:A/G-specific adenine glycosylase
MTSTARIEARVGRYGRRVIAFRRLLLAWFQVEGRAFPWRDPNASRYVQVISEVLLQRTRAEAVAAFFPRFIHRFRAWNKLAAATEKELQVFLEPIGLWRRRAAVLRALGKEMRARKGRFPSTRMEIEALPGIGQYIASAVLLFCHDGRQPLLDVNMARVLERCFGERKMADIRYDPWLQALSRRVVNSRKAIQINWAVLDLASRICTVRQPQCTLCPLRSCCRYASTHRENPKHP